MKTGLRRPLVCGVIQHLYLGLGLVYCRCVVPILDWELISKVALQCSGQGGKERLFVPALRGVNRERTACGTKYARWNHSCRVERGTAIVHAFLSKGSTESSLCSFRITLTTEMFVDFGSPKSFKYNLKLVQRSLRLVFGTRMTMGSSLGRDSRSFMVPGMRGCGGQAMRLHPCLKHSALGRGDMNVFVYIFLIYVW